MQCKKFVFLYRETRTRLGLWYEDTHARDVREQTILATLSAQISSIGKFSLSCRPLELLQYVLTLVNGIPLASTRELDKTIEEEKQRPACVYHSIDNKALYVLLAQSKGGSGRAASKVIHQVRQAEDRATNKYTRPAQALWPPKPKTSLSTYFLSFRA